MFALHALLNPMIKSKPPDRKTPITLSNLGIEPTTSSSITKLTSTTHTQYGDSSMNHVSSP